MTRPDTNTSYRYILAVKECSKPHWEDTLIYGVFPNLKEAEDRAKFTFPSANFKECTHKVGKRWYATDYHGTVETGPITVYNIYEVRI